MRIEFSPDLATGSTVIDQQHRELIDWCNLLNDPDAVAARGERLAQALRFVIGYVDLHFAAEERAMESAGYPGLQAHRKGHAYFRHEVKQLTRDLRSVDSARAAALKLHFLMRDWFVQHIRQTDRTMAAWLRQHAPDLAVEDAGGGLADLMHSVGITEADLNGLRVVKASELPRERRRER